MVNLKKIILLFLVINIILVTSFSSDSFVLGLMGKRNMYYEGKSLIELEMLILLMFYFLYILKNEKLVVNKKTSAVLAGIVIVFTYGIILSYYNGYKGSLFTAFHNYRYLFYSIIMCFMIVSMPLKKIETDWLIDIFLFIVFLKCIYGLFNFVVHGGNNFLILGNIVYAYGDTLNIILFSIAIAIGRYLDKKKNIYIIYTIIYIIVIILSMRRSVLGGLICIIVVYLVLVRPLEKLKIIVAIAVITLFAVIIMNSPIVSGTKISVDTVLDRIESINILNKDNSEDELTSDNGHIDDNLDAWDNVKDSPILGKGLFAKVRRPRVTWQSDGSYFHNAYLGVWIQCGLAGFCYYIILILLLMLYSFRKVMQDKEKYLNIAYISITVILVLQGFVTAPIYDSPGINIMFFIISGIVVNYNNCKECTDIEL